MHAYVHRALKRHLTGCYALQRGHCFVESHRRRRTPRARPRGFFLSIEVRSIARALASPRAATESCKFTVIGFLL